ncbi:MAG: DJ-1 family glyoxalase III [Candidatus Ozemobacteraceae bacterium]
MAKVFVLMAQGFEEMELVITVDILRRAGIDVETVALEDSLEPVLGSRKMRMVPDTTLARIDAASCDMVVLPGGKEGAERLGASEAVLELVRRVHGLGKYVAAICAAPAVLVKAGIMKGRRITCHPVVVEHIPGAIFQTHRVVVDEKTITSRAAGTTFEFAFTLVETLCGKQKIKEVNRGCLALLPDQLPELMS